MVMNGTTFTITSGIGEMDNAGGLTAHGNATAPSGEVYKWSIHGFAAINGGTVTVALMGDISAHLGLRSRLTYSFSLTATMS